MNDERSETPVSERVLVALDGSPAQTKILAEAVRYAQRAGAQLVLFRAVGIPVELPHAAIGLDPNAIAQVLIDAARADLDAQARSAPPGVVAGVRVELGTPWRSILDAARDVDADLVIIGSHGYGGLDRLLGTTAAKVVNHADRSVLVVRPH
jgi:nucleotide-binding universal stress UspA family protein